MGGEGLVRKREVTGDFRGVKAHEEGCRDGGREEGSDRAW